MGCHPTEVFRLTIDHGSYEAGTICYAFRGFDQGVARQDSIMTGRLHRSMTTSADGEGEFFTVPVEILELVNKIFVKRNTKYFI